MYEVTPLGLGLGAFMALVFGGNAGEVTVFGGGISGLRASPTACRHPDTAGAAQSETPPSASQTPLPTNRTTRAAVTVRAGGVPSSITTTACTVAAPSRFEWMATTSPSPRTALHDGAQPTDSTRNDGATFAAASESVVLQNLGYRNIKSLEPGQMVLIQDGAFSLHRFAEPRKPSHCFFEWIYFANVASTLDDRSVYLSRSKLGQELAKQERELNCVPLDDDTVVVPVPDTGKAAADAMAFALGIPSVEGLIRNRYIGRTFIEGGNRADKVKLKFTPLREVLQGKRVLLVEDSIVRSTTLQSLLHHLRDQGGAKEIHVRVACPPIVAPCFYGIDMSSVGELFAPRFLGGKKVPTVEDQYAMAKELGADSLFYLPVDAVARCIGLPEDRLCRACLTGDYPTPAGKQLYQLALRDHATGKANADGRTYERHDPLVCSVTDAGQT